LFSALQVVFLGAPKTTCLAAGAVRGWKTCATSSSLNQLSAPDIGKSLKKLSQPLARAEIPNNVWDDQAELRTQAFTGH
jgi:hypothetical protein